MRDRTRFALKQAIAIFLLVATLVMRVVPDPLVEAPRTLLMDGVYLAGAPLSIVTGAVLKVPRSFAWGGKSRVDLEAEIIQLTGQLAAKESELQRARQQIKAIGDFNSLPFSLLFFAYSGELVAVVRGGDTSVFNRSYIVNLGARHGVAKGFPVVWGRYAVGVVSEVGEYCSRVRLLSDPVSRVAVRLGGSRHQGILVGSGGQTCSVKYVPNRVPEGEIKAGDVVYTSGADTLFPPDLVVGKVARFVPQPSRPSATVEVDLAIDFSRIENCLVLRRKASMTALPPPP